MLRSLQGISGEELKVRNTDLGMLGLHGTLARVFPESSVGMKWAKVSSCPVKVLVMVARSSSVAGVSNPSCYGLCVRVAGFRAQFSARCDTTIWISVPVTCTKAVSSQRYEFRIFSSLCPGECILCTLPHLRENWIWGPWRASFPCGEQFLCFSLPLVYL